MRIGTGSGVTRGDDGRSVPYSELAVDGQEFYLTVRQYPRSTTVLMFEKGDKRDTRCFLKFANDQFDFEADVSYIIGKFTASMKLSAWEAIVSKWENLVEDNF